MAKAAIHRLSEHVGGDVQIIHGSDITVIRDCFSVTCLKGVGEEESLPDGELQTEDADEETQ